VRLTGIAYLDQAGQPVAVQPGGQVVAAPARGFTLLLRATTDLELLRAPPFWTRGRILAAAAAALAAFLLAVVWAWLLRRKVAEQTTLISAKIEREKVADERARIARELHDTVEQELAGIGLQLDLALARVATAPERARAAVDLALRMLRRTQGETRRSIQDLRSDLLERTDLAAALAEAAREFRDENHAPVHDRIEPPSAPLPALVEQHLLRIAREALGNAARHARATRIDLALENIPAGLRLSVSDDGAGFDPARPHPGHFGLQGMRERALKIGARFALETRPGAGSRITVELPHP
jgi:signal transduction histidine kinase